MIDLEIQFYPAIVWKCIYLDLSCISIVTRFGFNDDFPMIHPEK